MGVCGTDTEVGKTFLSVALIVHLRELGFTVAARKPAQSFDPSDIGSTDAELLAQASGEEPASVCPPKRWYKLPMAPPMAAEALGLPPFTTADLLDDLSWPEQSLDVGLIETAGGVGSPQASDGDAAHLLYSAGVDVAILVAHPGLGTISHVRLAMIALSKLPRTVVFLNRYDQQSDLHQRNREWLEQREGLTVALSPVEVIASLRLDRGSST